MYSSIVPFSFFNVAGNKMYATLNSETHTTCELDPGIASIVSRPIDTTVRRKTFVSTFDGCAPGLEFTITLPQGHKTLADLVNTWNANSVKLKKHILAMDADYSDPDYILLTNASDFICHVWADTYSYYGMWTPGEVRRFIITDFIADTIQAPAASPIIISQDIVLFEMTAYLYRRNKSGFYTKTDIAIVPSGFYKTPYALVATMNACITMRGERNGFIYNFIYDSATGLLGVEASHRQPEPSTLELAPLSPYLTASHMTLPLRTAKRIYFPLPLPCAF